jgi:hypothetical protein
MAVPPVLSDLVGACHARNASGRDGRTADQSSTRSRTTSDGTPSQEFEHEDIDRAKEASGAVKDYCSGAVSEAQRLGCESHVTEDDIP